jgi:hypothetical protein
MESSSSRDTVLSLMQQTKMTKLLQLHQSSFTSNLFFLDEVLCMACVDGIATLIVLDEFDALLGSLASLEPSLKLQGGIANRQLLLYHLLDCVTTQGTSLCLVAIMSHLATVSMLEKQVKSHAKGVSKVICLNTYPMYESLVNILLGKFLVMEGEDEGMAELQAIISSIVSKPDKGMAFNEKQQCIQLIMEQNFQLGKDMQW